MSQPPVIMWFRSDLRLTDNTALNAALRAGKRVIPLFVFDSAILNSSRTGAPRVAILLKALASLDSDIQKHGSALVVRHGNPVDILPQIIAQSGATALYFNRAYSPYALRRDKAVQAVVSVPVYSFDDALLVTPGDVMKADGNPYTVYTPFKKQWATITKALPEPVLPEAGKLIALKNDNASLSQFSLASLGFSTTIAIPDASEKLAQQRLSDFIAGPIYHYDRGRDRLASDHTHQPELGTSYLSAYFHLGVLSVREAFWAAADAQENALKSSAKDAVAIWISELAWREFYQHILFHFPHVSTGNFRQAYNQMAWRSAPDDFLAWQEGRTGYPVVDAAMRQLRQVGWMPNRARMIVASFLTKHLLIDWRAGEQHFMQWLLDGDVAANNGGWQWSAGTGTDAQPYFRIFNPITQSRKFDSDGTYIRRWVPELSEVPANAIHAPWEMNTPPVGYPSPIVEHRFARQRALDAYGAAKR